jgi:hypothetical protein
VDGRRGSRRGVSTAVAAGIACFVNLNQGGRVSPVIEARLVAGCGRFGGTADQWILPRIGRSRSFIFKESLVELWRPLRSPFASPRAQPLRN